MADYSGSTDAATAKTAAPTNGGRQTLIFQNISDSTMFLAFGGAAAVAEKGYQVVAGATVVLHRGDMRTIANRVSVICPAATGAAPKKYICSDDIS